MLTITIGETLGGITEFVMPPCVSRIEIKIINSIKQFIYKNNLYIGIRAASQKHNKCKPNIFRAIKAFLFSR
jgi:hypothetical protein